MLVGRHAAQMRAGRQRVRLGSHRWHRRLRHPARAQRRRHPDRRRVVASTGSSCCEAMGCEATIDRRAEGYQFWSDEHTQDEREWRRLGKKVRDLVGDDPDIVFEHPGRQTMGASVFIAKRGGTIVTCAATSGFMIEYDNRHLWMKLKRIVSLALRELPGGVEHEPPHRPGPHPPGHVRRCTRSRTWARPPTPSTRTRPRASSACSACRPRRARDPGSREARADRRGQDHAVPAPRPR